MKQKMKQWLGALLSMALILCLMPGMSLTAYADYQKAYADYDVTTTTNKVKSGDDLTALQVKFNEKPWYIIADNSTAVNAGTVTLLAAESLGTSKFHGSSNKYSTSTIKTYLDDMTTASDDAFVEVASAINTVKVKGSDSDTEVDAKLYLLSTDEAGNVPENVRKFSTVWWLRSSGNFDDRAAFVYGGDGRVFGYGDGVYGEFGVRPALKLNLASVSFSSESKEFSLKPEGYSVILSGGAYATTSGGATSQTRLTGAMTTVTYTANTGYYFAEFTDITDNGITATRTSSTVVTVSGTPTSDATITVPDAVEKTAATVTKAPTAKSLTYTGQAQGLVNAGEAENGTMQYALGTATKATQPYTTSIPTSTDAGTYYVWYKVVGDDNHTDTEPECVTVTIEDNSSIEPEVDQKDNTPKAEVEGLDEDLATNVMNDDEKNKVKIDASTGFYSGLKISQKNGKIKVSWDKGEDASKYAVYAAYCGKEFASKPVKTTKSTSATFKKINGKKIDFSKNLKIYVTAYDASGKKIGNTVSAHFAGKNNKKYKNAKTLKLSTKTLTLSIGKTAKIKASVKMEEGKKKELSDGHAAKFRYRSTNKNVATVDKNGNVTGVAAGTCEVYVYSRNGLAKKCTVTVK
ncbi:Ig-like domain-containing protein [Butyrivibrio sp. AC2005]|uniref:Ig-like domain-containing protein n=1 Tax=Butyrivibrio sp. AC2005 TaxID=1280672 RepID=UPI00047CEDDE|nr:Ig-like domain-containing protein [Butyrivibrio sp. AC2005]